MEGGRVRNWAAIVLGASALAAGSVRAQPAPAAATPAPAVAADDSTAAAAEPGLADRRRRWARPLRERVALVPAQMLRLPFQVVNYPVEHYLIHREPGAIAVYARRFTTALGRQGIEVQLRGMGPGSGYGGGIVYEAPRRLTRAPLRLSAVMTATGYDQFALALDSLRTGPALAGLRLQYAERPREDFFGLGPDSRSDTRATYQLDEWLAQATGSLPIGGGWRLAAVAGVSRNDIGRGRDPKYPTALEIFSPAIDGLQGRFEFLDWGGGLVFDSRDDPSYARRGSVVSARVLFADGVRDTPHAYTKYELEAQQFVPLWGQRRSLAMRLRGVVTDDRSGDAGIDVPVFRLERIGGSRSVRGYQSFRFTDKDALVGNVEYRFPIWNIEPANRQALDGAALFDFGTAVPDLAELEQSDLHSAAGLGLRFATRLGMLFRFDSMWSPEGYRGHFGLRGTF
jgi:hypothetical protein